MTELNNHAERDHALLSASSAHRWLACPPSAVAAEAYPQQDTPFTREGTLAHEVAEAVASGKQLPENEARDGIADGVTREMIECAKGYRDYIEELKKSNDAIVLLEQRVDFSPWVPQGFGTCDCILIQDDTLAIIDYKYGQGVKVDAQNNPQLRLYALGALFDFGIAYDVTKIEMHIYQPRLNNVSTDTCTVDELMDWAEKTVKPAAEKAYTGKGKHSPGEHCRFCPHAGRCRALTKTCTEYITVHGKKTAVETLAPWEVADVLRMEPLVSLWLKKVKEQAYTALMNGDEVPGFKLVEGKQGNRRWSNEDNVFKALTDAGYTADEITETKLLSPAAMDKALGKKRTAELLEGLIDRAPGQPTVVPETDKRPAYDRMAEALKDFD